ncbi:protein wech [Battus philenor]|uniref:protein wech n=1 Tax=Battus philenor TaxID=42288 RepID=UPI0035CEDB7C
MTSFANMTASLAASLPTTSSGASGNTSGHSGEQEDPLAMTHIICNLLENMNKPTNHQPAASTSASSTIPYDIWSLPSCSSFQNSIGTVNRDSNSHNNNHQNHSKEDNSSGSPGTSSSVSITCFRCEERTPTTRCLECNDLFCYECCHKVTSDCQLREHTLLPIHQISPIGVRPNSVPIEKEVLYCELHGDPVKFYCEGCIIFICQECILWVHKDHNFTPIKGAVDVCRLGVYKAIEDTKTGTKAIKTAIDRAVAMSKAYEKESAEANLKIRKAMRCYAQAIEDREKYLLDKVEKMRQAKITELTDHMNTLRGILAGLAHTNETLVRSMDSEGIDMFMAKEKARAQVDYFSCMFKSMYIAEERIMFIPPNYDLVDQIKRQCDVQPAPVVSMPPVLTSASCIPSRQSLLSMQSLQSAHSFSPLSYHISASSNLRNIPDYPSNHTRSTNYYDHSISSSIAGDSNSGRGIGQAIPGYWMAVTVRPTRSPVPGVPMFSFGKEGQEEGQVSRPWGLCVDREGNIIVADRRNNRIQIFSNRGEFKMMFGAKGTGPGEFDLPAGITTDTYGRIIVIDKDNHRVQIFTSSGNFILKFGSFGKECGQFQYPWDVAVNTLGNIVVTDTRNHRIQLFTSDGSYITKFVFEAANPAKLLKGPTTPRGVCFTTSGNIIVSDFENHRLLMVDPTLSKVLHCIGREGSGIGELNRPSGIVTDDDGRIIVADSKNHRVLVFTSELRILWAVDLKSPGLDDKDRPSDVALTPEGFLVVLFETLPDTARDIASHGKQYIKVY